MHVIAASIVLATVILAGAGSAQAQDTRCFANWSEAAQVAKKEQLVGVEQLSRFSKAQLGGDIVKSTLCAIGQRFRYRLIVRPKEGPLRSVEVDARKPFDK
jgi:hypothetical protein